MLLTASSRTLEGAHKRRLEPATTEVASLAMTGFTEYLLADCLKLNALVRLSYPTTATKKCQFRGWKADA
jgi:hypothetical protein